MKEYCHVFPLYEICGAGKSRDREFLGSCQTTSGPDRKWEHGGCGVKVFWSERVVSLCKIWGVKFTDNRQAPLISELADEPRWHDRHTAWRAGYDTSAGCDGKHNQVPLDQVVWPVSRAISHGVLKSQGHRFQTPEWHQNSVRPFQPLTKGMG